MDHVRRYDTGPITERAVAAVVGGRLVEARGNREVGPAAAGSVVCMGVALRDAAVGQDVGVDHEGTHRLRAAAAVAAGQRVMCAAAGEVTPWVAAGDPRTIIGFAREAIAAGADGNVTLTLG